MTDGRLTPPAWAALSAASLCLVVAAALAVAAPRLVRPVATATATPSRADTTAPVVRLEDRLDQLPIVVRDLPDASSRAAVATYDAAHIHESSVLATMFTQAWSGLAVPPGGEGATAGLADYLVFAGPSADPDSDYGDVLPGPFFNSLAQPAIAALTVDSRNADRLSNAAVALFDLGVSEDYAGAASVAGRAVAPASTLRLHAVRLLGAASEMFPDARVAWLDSAYLTSVASQGICSESHMSAAATRASGWLRTHPDDLTARLLASSLTARATVKPSEVDLAMQTLQPALASPDVSVIARAVRADDHLALADRLGSTAPYLAKRYAADALGDYDAALAAAPGAGLRAGRAAALDRLGRTAEALAEQRQAATDAPDSIELQLGMAHLQEETGDFVGMRASARNALQLAVGNPDPAVRGTRLVAAPDPAGDSFVLTGDRGLLGWSFGSEVPQIGVFELRYVCQGGGYVAAQDIIPSVPNPPPAVAVLSSFPQDRALFAAVSASMLLGDLYSGSEDLLHWAFTEALDPRLAGNPDWTSSRGPAVRVLMRALQMSATSPLDQTSQAAADPNQGLAMAQYVLRHGAAAVRGRSAVVASQILFKTAEMCRQLLAPTGQRPNVALALVCDAQASYVRGDFRRAVVRLRDADAEVQRESADFNSPAPRRDDVDLELAVALRSVGDQADARPLFEHAAAAGEVELGPMAPLEQLGTMMLDQGQPQAATAYFDLALQGTSLAGLALQDRSFLYDAPGDVGIVQRVYNNRGIALLRSLQKQPDVPPDCRRNPTLCQAARDDFLHALGFDPANPDYLLNLGWTARLLGDRRQAVDALNGAGSEGPIAFSALNDLGVLAARAGDERTARRALESALALAPNDDLPAWNLGILWLHDWPAGIPQGEAYLARAIKRNPGLATAALDYRTDERVYRHTFLADPPPPASQGAGPNLTIATLQAATVASAAGAAGGLAGTLTKAVDALRDKGLEFLADRQRELRGRLRRIGTARLRRLIRTGEPWLLTGLAMAAVSIVTAWPPTGVALASAVTIGLFAVLTAALVHESGHLLAARRAGVQVRPVFWAPGIVLALVLLPFRLSTGPYVGHRAQRTVPAEVAWWLALAGPAANLVAAAAAYLLYRLDPLPLLRVMAQAQLFTLGFTILPFRPLDGGVLVKRHPWVVAALGLTVGVGATALGVGRL